MGRVDGRSRRRRSPASPDGCVSRMSFPATGCAPPAPHPRARAAGNRQFDLGPVTGFAPDVQLRTDFRSALTHASQAPVAHPCPLATDVLSDAATVVAEAEHHAAACTGDPHFDARGVGMAECIGERFAAYPVDLVAHDRIQRGQTTFAHEAGGQPVRWPACSRRRRGQRPRNGGGGRAITRSSVFFRPPASIGGSQPWPFATPVPGHGARFP